MGMFFCVWREVLAPRARRWRSVDLWRAEPVAVVVWVVWVVEGEVEERRCESRRRRWRARSFFRCKVSVGSSVVLGVGLLVVVVVLEEDVGGFEDWGVC